MVDAEIGRQEQTNQQQILSHNRLRILRVDGSMLGFGFGLEVVTRESSLLITQ